MNPWRSGPASLVRRWLGGEERDPPLKEYQTEGCLAWRTPVEGKFLEEESNSCGDLEVASHKVLA